MSFYGLELILEEVGTNLRRDRVITVATVGITAVSLCVLGAILLLMLNVQLWTGQIASQITIRLHLKRDVTRARAEGLRAEIASWPHVASARLITKEEGWEELKALYPAIHKLEDLPIPVTDAIEVNADRPENLPGLAQLLGDLREKKALKPDTASHSGVTQKIIRLRSILGTIAIALVIAMAFVGFIIAHNTIRLSLFARRREIAIMQMVGATPEFVAAPFLIEGALIGLIGAALACCVLVPGHMYLRALAAQSGWTVIKLLPDGQLIPLAAALAGFGVLLGFCGAALSLRRFLSHRLDTH
jgi:cell division transport system permease protein